jgi:hypothetical protein
MSNYLPHYTKRLRIRRKREEHLRRLISRGAQREKLLHAAEEVRLVRIHAMTAQKANPPRFRSKDECTQWGNAIDAKLLALGQTTAAAILAEFE